MSNTNLTRLFFRGSIEEYHPHVDGIVFLDMPEMGVEGAAIVQAIEPCPTIADGPGRVVTATYKHRNGEVYDLKVTSEREPIGSTSEHPIYSEDRKDFIRTTELQIGERVKTVAGFANVESIDKRPKPEPVYNIEVEGDHVYRVGESGVLVHNTSAAIGYPCGERLQNMAGWGQRASSLRSAVVSIHQGFPVGNTPGRNFRNQKTTPSP